MDPLPKAWPFWLECSWVLEEISLLWMVISQWLVCVLWNLSLAPSPQELSSANLLEFPTVHAQLNNWLKLVLGNPRQIPGALPLHICLLPLCSEDCGYLFGSICFPVPMPQLGGYTGRKPRFSQGSQPCGVCCPVTKNSCFLHFV